MTFSSLNDPVHIDAVKVPFGSDCGDSREENGNRAAPKHGEIGMTACPGRKGPGSFGYYDRDLAVDLLAIRNWDAEVLVSLIEDHEYHMAGIEDFDTKLPEGLKHLKMPIPDGGTPDEAWERRWEVDGRVVREVLSRGGKVCLHCMGGLGRTGMIAARLLVEFGLAPDEAIAQVRKARPGTIETAEQMRYIRQCTVNSTKT